MKRLLERSRELRVGATMGVKVGEFGSELEVSRLSERSKVESRRQIRAGKLELVRF